MLTNLLIMGADQTGAPGEESSDVIVSPPPQNRPNTGLNAGGLVAPPPSQDGETKELAADGWFPPVKLADLRTGIRMGGGVVSTDRLVDAMEGAILSAIRDLTEWRAVQLARGIMSLSDVPAIAINGTSSALMLWDRIVRYYTAAELADGHRDISATDDGLDRAEEKSDSADMYRRLAYHAVADLRSIGADAPVARNLVALI